MIPAELIRDMLAEIHEPWLIYSNWGDGMGDGEADAIRTIIEALPDLLLQVDVLVGMRP